MTLVFAMLTVLLTWALWALLFSGVGLLVRRAVGIHTLEPGHWFLSFWCGVAAAIGLLQIWNFFAPVNGIASSVVAGIGIIGLALHSRSIVPELRRWKWSPRVLPTMVVLFWLANRSIGPGNADDSGLYHYSAIRWANEHPVVTGIGNLASTLAMNNASFLYTALLNTGRWAGRAEHFANGLLLAVFWLQVLHGMSALLRRGQAGSTPASMFMAMMLPPALMLAMAKDVSSPKTDLPAGAFIVVIMHLLLVMAGRRDESMTASQPAQTHLPDQARLLPLLALLCAAATCIKISMIAIAGVAGLVGVVLWWRSTQPSLAAACRTAAVCLVVVAAMLGPWVGRNVMMSGYPLYPAKVAALDVNWRVPPDAVDFLQNAIRNHAKAGLPLWLHDVIQRKGLGFYAPLIKPPFSDRDGVRGFNWVRAWFFSLPLSSPIEIVVPMSIAALCGAMGLWRRWRRGAVPQPSGFGATRWMLLAAPCAGLAFWFLAGPDPRYGWPAAWSIAGLSVALSEGWRSRPRLVALASLALLVPVIAYRLGVQLMLDRTSPLHQVVLFGPGPDHGFHPRPSHEMKLVRTRWGATVFVPASDNIVHCFNGPLPCTGWPPLDPDLKEREPGNFAGGYLIDRRATDPSPVDG